MKRKYIALALIAALALMLVGCGKTAQPVDKTLGLAQWDLTAGAWSSNNGATVTLTAEPIYHEENQTASFVIRLEGEDVENVECQFANGVYTAEADLNSADGYCYYVVMRSADGESVEVEVNTPNNPTDEKLINMAHALDAYCHMAVSTHALNADLLTITGGTAEIRLPEITRDGKPAACEKAELVLYYNGEETARTAMVLPEELSQMELKGINFTIPAMEDDQQLSVTMEVTLTDGQVLSAPGGTWFYTDGQLVLAIG